MVKHEVTGQSRGLARRSAKGRRAEEIVKEQRRVGGQYESISRRWEQCVKSPGIVLRSRFSLENYCRVGEELEGRASSDEDEEEEEDDDDDEAEENELETKMG